MIPLERACQSPWRDGENEAGAAVGPKNTVRPVFLTLLPA